MNYYEARELSDHSGYHYTCMNDGRVRPVGYCSRIQACPACGDFGKEGCEQCGGEGFVDLGVKHYQTHVHGTPEEARECFARYLLDGWREERYGNWQGCEWEQDGERCDAPTKSGLTTRPPLGVGYPLCDEHRTLDHLRALAPSSAGQICASY